MNVTVYAKLKKGKSKALQYLYSEELKRSWFICYHIAEYEEDYVSLFVLGWKNAIRNIVESENDINEEFRDILYINILKLSSHEIDPLYQEIAHEIKVPKTDEKYQVFVDAIDNLEKDDRTAYLLSVFGRLSNKKLSQYFNKSESKMKEYLSDLSVKTQNTPEIKKLNGAAAVILSTQFRSIGGSVFDEVVIPNTLFSLLESELKPLVESYKKQWFKKRKQMPDDAVTEDEESEEPHN